MNAAGPHDLMVPDEAGLLERVLVIVRALARELHPEMRGLDRLDADASLERAFGLDSLARVELALRIERDLGMRIPDAALAESDTARELVRALSPAAEREVAEPVTRGALPEPGAAPPLPVTLVDALEWHATEQPNRTHILLADHEASPQAITFGSLRAEARALAAGLHHRGIRAGEAVAIMLPTGREFFAAFYGVLYAGAVPVPLYPPARPSQLESHLRRVAGILANCEARLLLTFERARGLAQLLRSLSAKLEAVATVPGISASDALSVAAARGPSDIAFLQYTSGSTGQPKGVVLTHGNLLANLNAMQRATGVTSADCFVSWLPLYHDMGLIGACFGALVLGFPLVLMSPFAFLSHPLRWLRTIDRHRATITAAPNFAYEMCITKIDERELADLDLSSLRLAFNGAEAVSSHTLERFAQRFARCGLRRSAQMPVYGLAEGALGLTFPPPDRGPLIDRIDRDSFLRQGRARTTEQAEPAAMPVVSCGKPLPGHLIRIVDAAGTPLPERMQGRIEFQGPSATSGYFKNPKETARLFNGKWLDTGDLGYLANGELYVTGRAKDIIIRGGHNIHPQELEEAIGQLPEVRKGGVVVFPATDRRSATERVVALVETRAPQTATRAELIARINHLAIDLIGLPIDEVVLAPPRTVLKTSSGKIRRAACREAYERGKLGAGGRAPWLQLTRLELAGLATTCAHRARSLARALWGARALLVAACLAPLLWAAVVSMPGLKRRRAAGAVFMRLAMRLANVSLRVQQPTQAARGPRVYASNHASYLDALVLMGVLPLDVAFVAKNEFRKSVVLGTLFKRLGCVFVERHDMREAVAAAGALEERLRAYESLHVFAEGTFERDPGLLPFHLGAFRAAANTGAAVVPIAVCGTRAMLPDGAWRPRPTSLEVIIGEPVMPEDGSWRTALQLRRVTRAFILSHVNEPDLEDASPSGAP
jgi:1-acyl-sn-glycerol-3-phosphate acyltransferase